MKNPKRYHRIIREKKQIHKVSNIGKNHNIDQRVYWSIICKYLNLESLRQVESTCCLLREISFHTVKERFKCHPSQVYFPEIRFHKVRNYSKQVWISGTGWNYGFNQENVKRIQLPQSTKKINNTPNYSRKRKLFR